MRSKSSDIGFVALFALAALVVVIFDIPVPAIRFLVALPLVLILPGYALSTVIFANNDSARQSGQRENTGTVASKVVCTIGGSLVITILGGFVLNATPWGLQAKSWVILLAAVTLIAALLGVARRDRSGVAIVEKSPSRIGILQTSVLGIAALLACMAVFLSILGGTRHHTPGFTQFWILPSGSGLKGALHIGVASRESRAQQYSISVSQGNQLVREWPPFGLKPGQTWTGTLALPMGAGGTVEAHLIRLDHPGRVYRRVTLGSDELAASSSSHGVGGGP